MAAGGQTLNDRLLAARHSLAGQGLAKAVCKATTEELIGPKRKHLECESEAWSVVRESECCLIVKKKFCCAGKRVLSNFFFKIPSQCVFKIVSWSSSVSGCADVV